MIENNELKAKRVIVERKINGESILVMLGQVSLSKDGKSEQACVLVTDGFDHAHEALCKFEKSRGVQYD